MFAAVLFSALGALATSQTTTLVFAIDTPRASSSLSKQTETTMQKRLKTARVSALVRRLRGGRVEVSISGKAPSFLSKLLTAPGNVVFRVVPNGDVYRAPGGRPIRDAISDDDLMGNPEVTFHTVDPQSFYRFTGSHVDKQLGIYLDGRLLTSPRLTQPFSDTGEIVGGFTREETELMAAIIGSGPLPAPVHLVSKTTRKSACGKCSII